MNIIINLLRFELETALDTPIVAHFKSLAGERGYQTLINDTLRRAIEGEHIEADLRRIVREELDKAAN